MLGWQGEPRMGVALLLLGTAAVTLLVLAIDRLVVTLPNPGVIYLPLIALLAYHWSWRLGALGGLLQIACIYVFFLTPVGLAKPVSARDTAQLVTLAAVNVFTLLLVQLARAQRDRAARQAGRAQALNLVGGALTSELDEGRLLRLIAQTARELTGAGFAAFTLRPLDAQGQPQGSAEGSRFHLAAVVGVTPEQEALFRRLPLGGEGLLAPIFRHGVPVRVADALGMTAQPAQPAQPTAAPAQPTAHGAGTAQATPSAPAAHAQPPASAPAQATGRGQGRASRREAARQAAMAYAHGALGAEALHAVGIPRGHPVVRSFLGVPLLDRAGQVRGGLLLGHTAPGRFSAEDERLLSGLAAQAAVALENARLYREAQTQAQELDAIVDSISDAVLLVDGAGQIVRANRAASTLLSAESGMPGGMEGTALEHVVQAAQRAAGAADMASAHSADRASTARIEERDELATGPATTAHHNHSTTDIVLTTDAAGEEHQYAVTATPLREAAPPREREEAREAQEEATTGAGAVVVWHDLTQARRLLRERQARAEADSRRALLQLVIDELPGGIYLVRGPQARLVLANQAAREAWGATWAEGQPMAAFLAQRGVRILSPTGQPLTEVELATVRAVRSGEPVRHHQEIIRRPDGTALPVLLNAVALDPGVLPFAATSTSTSTSTGIGGTPAGSAAALARVVEENAVAADQHAHDEHDTPDEQDAQERAALVVLQDVTALKEAERVKDEFITIAAHELKTPMTAVKGYTDMLRRRSTSTSTTDNGETAATAATANAAATSEEWSAADADAPTPAPALAPWQLDALETIDQATDRLVELTDDLLDVARLQANRVELHLEPHDLLALARRVAKRLQFSTTRHTLRVESAADAAAAAAHTDAHADDTGTHADTHAEEGHAHADTHAHAEAEYVVARLDVRRVEQVVGNLLSNAIKYSPQGGPITVTVRAEGARGEAVLTVRDRGIGIPAAQQARLFARFARADNARAAGIGGTGLGLYLSRELVERHGGRIWFESTGEEGAGTAFSIALPLATDEDEGEEAEDNPF